MSEKETKEEQKVRVYDIVSTFKDAEGNTKTEFHEYGFIGNLPESIVDYGKYWDFGGGCLYLFAEDGIELRHVCDIADGWDIGDKFDECCTDLKPGEWAEWKVGDKTIRVTALADIPRISAEKSIANSDLSHGQMNKVRIYGKLLFDEGGMANGTCFRPNLANEINAIWTEYVCSKCDEEIEVEVDETYHSADHLVKKVTVKAPGEKALHDALFALGVKDPAKVAVEYTIGEGETVRQVTAAFLLSDFVE